ncbi:SDR family NAD(P)-dependent oxidoreductase [Micromonospora sp. NPDC000442]|uniref:SDR family NAD(P)-dependent oxidoreductase n=1 Tax=Micromonospora sp. NPDC000442 TaxID=3364217 RepID=UPI0036861B0A
MGDSSTQRPFAVVTGASSGIGFELARQFVQHGYDVVMAAEDAELDVAATSLRRDSSATVTAARVDLAKPEGVERLYQEISDTGRPVDAVALNAGVGQGGDFARQTDLSDELVIIDLNCRSTVHLAKRIVPDLLRRGSGRVLFTSSIASTMPGTYQAVYNASKSFVQSFAEALREELKDTGITVTSLMPGPTDTEFFERADLEDTKLAERKDDPAEVARQGFEAMMNGDAKVVAGSLMNKVQAVGGRLIPDAVKAKLHGEVARPGSAS